MPSRRIPRSFEPSPWGEALERRRRGGHALLDLAESDPTRVGLSDPVVAAAALATAGAGTHAPEARGSRVAREAIAAYYASRGLTVGAGDLTLTSGTSEGYAHLLRLLCDPGDDVLVPAPGYPLLEPIAALESVTLRPYRLGFDGAWHWDADALERARTPRTRAVILVQPHHPTGTIAGDDALRDLDAWCARHGLAIVSDEVFGDLLWGTGAAEASPSLLAAPRRAPAFVLHGLSKLCGMPQLKLGWIASAGAAVEPAWARGLEWIADTFLSVAAPVQAALPGLLDERHAFRRRVAARVARNRARLDVAAARTPAMSLLPAAAGWAAMVRLPEARSDEGWAMALLARDVVVHAGHLYDVERPTSLVVSLIADPVSFDEGVTRLERLVAEE